MAIKRVQLQEYRSEFNLRGTIYRSERDPQTQEPFIDVPEELLQALADLLDAPILPSDPADLNPQEGGAGGGGSSSGEGGGAGDGGAGDGADLRTLSLNSSDAQVLISEIQSVPELLALQAGEITHDKHPGGRQGVLKAIAARIVELNPTT